VATGAGASDGVVPIGCGVGRWPPRICHAAGEQRRRRAGLGRGARPGLRGGAALGTKDHARPGAGLDASDQDGGVDIRTWPVQGLYMPDAIGAFEAGGPDLPGHRERGRRAGVRRLRGRGADAGPQARSRRLSGRRRVAGPTQRSAGWKCRRATAIRTGTATTTRFTPSARGASPSGSRGRRASRSPSTPAT
jgi:hypothetical protein